ncbi:glycosyltransferase [Beijerinckia indica]|uniref:Glycosyl transferase group 1 n=1 Tax=Beijerinckia indica subsp. indica (strain ATCC 9039 / DSM 1715 / NCIMB 8712) TaxID=395963 RepID=B2IFY9_BEII9|nr:glycosyltransferase [Beijerinckia indica]ACB95728.1 glycosyl transferase group 1 [Beijerinckia indica subsp. indica ATCC 9039]
MRQPLFPPLLDRARHPLNRRTVLQIVPSLVGGDTEHIALEIAAAITEAGGKALVASEGGRLVSSLQAMGGLWIPFPAASRDPLAMLLNIRKLARLIEMEKVDLVHAHSRASAWVAYGATRRTKTPFVTTFHSGYTEGIGLQQRYNSVMARGDCIIAHSHYSARRIEARYPQARTRIKVIPQGIDFQVFAPQSVDPARVQALRQAWGITPDQRAVLLTDPFSDLSREDGGGTDEPPFIEAARLLRAQNLEGVVFILTGDATPPLGRGQERGREQDQDKIQEHGGSSARIKILTNSQAAKDFDRKISAAGLSGIMRRAKREADLPAALLASAAVVAPIARPGGFGPLAIAAQAMGTPMILPALGAAPEIILAPPQVDQAERTGWLVPPGNAAALAATLGEVLSLGATARGLLGERGRRHVEAHFSLDEMCRATLDAYGSLFPSGEE